MISLVTLNRIDLMERSFREYTRYWSQASQPYASGDQLYCYLVNGWEVETRIEIERRTLRSGRWIKLYHFSLYKGQLRLFMPVMGGPFVTELLDNNRDKLELVHFRSLRRIRLQSVEKVSVALLLQQATMMHSIENKTAFETRNLLGEY